MTLNPLGLVAALTAFFSIWFGHVAVRRLEFVSPTIWFPTVLFSASGLFVEYCSLLTGGILFKTALGIFGVTLLWDALEFTRQQRRVRRGHAPANPANPRHMRFLGEPDSHATLADPLKREPTWPLGQE